MITVKNKARPWRRIYKFDPLLDPLVIACLVTVVAQRKLSSVPQLFPGGALLGDVIAALALSFIGAWFFNLLVIRLPKRRDKSAFAEVSGNLVARYASTAVNILRTMARESDMPPPTRQPDDEYLKLLFSKVRPAAEAPMVDSNGQHVSWIHYMNNEIERSAGLLRRLIPHYPQMEAATVAAITAVENTTLVQTTSLLVSGPPIGNRDMGEFSEPMMALWTACARVGDRYLAEIAPLLAPEQRYDIDNLDGSTPPPPAAKGARRWLRKADR